MTIAGCMPFYMLMAFRDCAIMHLLTSACCAHAGRFSPKAEVINGRLACLGFAALLILESKAKVPFF